MKLTYIALLTVLGAALAGSVVAQPRGGQGMGQGMGPGGGMGPGAGMGRSFNLDKDTTSGWAMMSAEERAAHQSSMMAAKSYQECKATQAAHHEVMMVRAEKKGLTLPTPRFNACDRMQARGFFK